MARVHPQVEVKFLPKASAVAFAILDSQRAFFVSPTATEREALYAMTADAAIVRAFEAQFDAHWANAVPIRPSPKP